MSAPRLVATDLDGTLVRSDGTVSSYTREVLVALEERRVPVVVVTARPLRWMDEIWPLVGHVGLAIVANGGLVVDAGTRRVLRTTGIDPGTGLDLVTRVRTTVPEAVFAIESERGIALGDGWVEPHPVPPDSPIGPIEELWTAPAVKLLVRAPGWHDDLLRAGVVEAIGARAEVTWSGEQLVEVSPPGVDKATALAQVCADLGVDAADVVAFGDMPNDLSMLRWAGASYAMANGHPDVRAVADHVAPANDADGVAVTLASLFALD